LFPFSRSTGSADTALLHALGRSLALIEFSPEGVVLDANANFCRVLGYDIAEIRGHHHRLFVDPKEAESAEYKAFWARLAQGQFESREFRRIAKGDRDVYIQASYNPVLDRNGRVTRVVKAASDITAAKLRNSDFEAKLEAISRVQAVIEFLPNGEIVTANDNFLRAVGYRLEEIKGRPHRMFVTPEYAASAEYAEFWARLNRGEPIAATFRRVGAHGKRIILQASYNPVFDLRGRVAKIVKFGSDFSDLGTLGEGMSRLADNDLETPIEQPFQAMFEPLRADYNRAQQTLRSAIAAVSQSVERVTANSREIATASGELSQRAEQQAATLEETTAAIEGVTGTVAKTADKAREATTVAGDAKIDAEKSGEIMRRAVDAIGRIEKSSQEIAQIIGVIDEIAFQTNLLALNAGVEAARAGEAGRGFAVVASEVRALAQRSADAAKEIKGLISVSTGEVRGGVLLVADAGGALEVAARSQHRGRRNGQDRAAERRHGGNGEELG